MEVSGCPEVYTALILWLQPSAATTRTRTRHRGAPCLLACLLASLADSSPAAAAGGRRAPVTRPSSLLWPQQRLPVPCASVHAPPGGAAPPPPRGKLPHATAERPQRAPPREPVVPPPQEPPQYADKRSHIFEDLCYITRFIEHYDGVYGGVLDDADMCAFCGGVGAARGFRLAPFRRFKNCSPTSRAAARP